jgi:hypothetical protein
MDVVRGGPAAELIASLGNAYRITEILPDSTRREVCGSPWSSTSGARQRSIRAPGSDLSTVDVMNGPSVGCHLISSKLRRCGGAVHAGVEMQRHPQPFAQRLVADGLPSSVCRPSREHPGHYNGYRRHQWQHSRARAPTFPADVRFSSSGGLGICHDGFLLACDGGSWPLTPTVARRYECAC